mgnify:FL=1
MINKKGFTLLELVIVIGILAVLGAVSVMVLNPAQLFAQARDTTRIEDVSVLRNALALYVSTVSAADLDGPGAASCSASCFVGVAGTGLLCGSRHVGATKEDVVTRVVDGTGWIPVNLGDVPGGPALSVLPVDPTNNATYFYSYACSNTAKTYELDANLESTRYCAGGTDDKESKDGGNMNTGSVVSGACTGTAVYEVGTDAGLDL